MKRFLIVLLLMILPGATWAESSASNVSVETNDDGTHSVTMTALDALKLAAAMVDDGNLDTAEQILTKMPPLGGGPLEIERWFLLGRIAGFRGDFDTAIEIYRTVLDAHPDLARVRFELAICYMKTSQWYRADHQLRLAMAGEDLPDNVRQMMNYYRYFVRQNKNWNIWFNFGATPDNNINNANGGTQIVNYMGGKFYSDLPDPISAIGYNFTLGGNYEFKLSDQWRWKSDAGAYASIYDIHDYDDLYLYASTGPRFIWSRGDIWLAAVGARRWYGWDEYNWSAGARINTNYDFTRKLSGGLNLQYTRNSYDDYGDYLDGDTFAANINAFYSITPNIYAILRGGASREITVAREYSYWMPNISIGIGAELPYGFNVYVEPALYWQLYDAPQWVIYNQDYTRVTERDFNQRYSVSISNNKFDVMGFLPTIVFSYTRRDSNLWQREYDRWAVEFTMSQRF